MASNRYRPQLKSTLNSEYTYDLNLLVRLSKLPDMVTQKYIAFKRFDRPGGPRRLSPGTFALFGRQITVQVNKVAMDGFQ